MTCSVPAARPDLLLFALECSPCRESGTAAPRSPRPPGGTPPRRETPERSCSGPSSAKSSGLRVVDQRHGHRRLLREKRNTKDDPNLFLCLAFKALTTLRQNYGSTNSKSRYVYIFKHIFVEEYWHIFWYLSNFRFEQFGFTLTERKLSNLIENMNKFD